MNALQNLFNVVMADPRLTATEFTRSLANIWQGIASNKKETIEVAKALKNAGFDKPAKVERALAPV